MNELHALVERISEPRGYFQGALAPDLVLPSNILVFQRKRASSLGQRARSLHHRYVLIFNLRDAGNVIVDDLFVRLAPGQALLIFPHQFHSYQVEPDRAELLWLFVTFDLDRGAVPESMRQRPVDLSSAAEDHLHALVKAWLQPQSSERNSRVALETALLMHHLIANAGGAGQPKAAQQDRFDRTLARVCKFIQARMHKGIRIKNIASDESISESHLRLLFRTRMGTSLGDYLHSMRMIRATQLLAQSELSIEEIGLRCGYGSIYAFSRAFSKAMKQSPRVFRRSRAESVR